MSGCRQQQRGRDAYACMNILCFYTLPALSSLPTGGIIYNPHPPLNRGERRAPYCGEYISKYEESPETRHFMDQQEARILKWVESCWAGVCTPFTSASAQGRNGPECTSSLSGSSWKYLSRLLRPAVYLGLQFPLRLYSGETDRAEWEGHGSNQGYWPKIYSPSRYLSDLPQQTVELLSMIDT